MPRRIDLGRAVLLGGAGLLFISLFLRWYDTGPTGWEVFETLDLVLAALAVGGVVIALAPAPPSPAAAFGVPGAAIAIVLVQLLDAPPAAGDGRPSTGAWLALAGAMLMAAGVAQSLTSISVTVEVGERRLRRRVAAVDLRGDELGGAEPVVPPEAEPDALRSGRLDPHPTPSDDLQRTQPLSALSDLDDVDQERP